MGAIYLVRHGQASFGKADYDKLSEAGVEQAQVLGKSLRARLPQLDAVWCGAMRRHRQTAEHCLSTLGEQHPLTVHEGFNEFAHEEIIERYKPLYANRLLMMADLARTLEPRRAFQQVFEQAVARWVGGAHDDDYTESWPAFKARCRAALDDIVRELGSSRTALVFTSGGPITVICQQLLGIPDAQAFTLNRTLANAGVTKLVYGRGGVHVSTLNEHAHFEGLRRDLITYR